MKILRFVLLGLTLSLFCENGMSQTTYYVDNSNETGTHDGLSWETAFKTFGGAIYHPLLTAGDTIFVAKGTYQTPVDNAFYIVKPEIHVFGGFPTGGSALAERNWEVDSTILLGNGDGVIGMYDTYKSEIDGFYITGGGDELAGGGINNQSFGSVFRNLVIYENKGSVGGGFFNGGSNVLIENAVFKNDTSYNIGGWGSGGALYTSGDNVIIKNSSFKHNYSEGGNGASGGAVMNEGNNVSFINVVFEENTVYSSEDHVTGGAVNSSANNIGFYKVSFRGNKVISLGDNARGGAIALEGSGARVSNCEFVSNQSLASETASAGAISNYADNFIVENTLFETNEISSSNAFARGGAILNNGENSLLSFCVFNENSSQGINGISFGGAVTNNGGGLRIENNVFYNNLVESVGGGNGYGGALVNAGALLEVVNSTFVKNKAFSPGTGAGGGLVNVGLANIENSVFWENEATTPFVDLLNQGSITVNNSFTQSDNTSQGNGNIQGTESPFRDIDDLAGIDGIIGTADDGLILACGSLAIDAGSNDALDGLTKDITGFERVNNATVDMGAYEHYGEVESITEATVCATSPYSWKGETYTTSGSYFFVNGTDENGCETIEVLVLENEDAITYTELVSNDDFCINTGFVTVAYTTSNVSEVEMISGLPEGVTVEFTNNTILLSGTPTEAGEFLYTLRLKGCGDEFVIGKIVILPAGQVVEGLDEPLALCKDQEIYEWILSTTKFTGISSFDGLPAGLHPEKWGDGIYMIGTPSETGTFNYTITFSGCEEVVHAGILTVVEDNEILTINEELMLCVNSAISVTTHEVIGVMTAIKEVVGLPEGLAFTYESNELILTGIPTETGSFTYTVIPQEGCTKMTGTLTVHGEAMVQDANLQPTVCVNHESVDIYHGIENVSEFGTIIDLPEGMTVEILENQLKIAGIPTEVGVFNYQIAMIGGCDVVIASGTITVVEEPIIDEVEEVTTCVNETMESISITGSGLISLSSTEGLPQGLTAELVNGKVVISGTPLEDGEFTYEVEVQTFCGALVATGTLSVTSSYVVDNTHAMTETCAFTLIDPIVHLTQGVTAIEQVEGLPNGVFASFSNGVIVLSGLPSETGTFNYTITVESELCGEDVAEGIVVVNEVPELSIELLDDGILQATASDVDLQWINCDTGELVDGENSSIFVPTESGTYAVIATNTNGCETVSDCITVSTINIKTELVNTLSAYPNPTRDVVTIDFGKTINKATILLMDVTGKRLQKQEVTNINQHNLNLNKYIKGVYLMEIRLDNNEQQIIKIIKE